jgi:hypothetical protein
VQFAAPVQPAWFDALVATGVTIVSAVPNNAYLVYGDAPALNRARTLPATRAPVQASLPYAPAFRIDPAVDINAAQPLTVQLYAGDAAANAQTIALLDRLATGEVRRQDSLHYINLSFDAAPGSVLQIADRPDVVAIHRFVMPRRLDERQNRIVSGFITGNAPTPGDHLAWLAQRGFEQTQFDASGFVVDVTDSGIDAGGFTPPALATTNHFALHRIGAIGEPSRVSYARLEGTPNGTDSSTAGADGHGTLNAHVIAGYVPSGGAFASTPHADAQGFRYGLGVAPFVRVGSSVIFDPDVFTFPDYEDLAARAYRDAARISSNSWGGDAPGVYGAASQAYDALTRDAQPTNSAVPVAGNQEMVFVVAAGNDGPGAGTLGSPGTGKNVITVGASENVHAFGAPDQCGFADTAADSANDIGAYSSRGPVSGGRRKPDLVAPGSHVTGGLWQALAIDPSTLPVATGTAAPAFTASGICAGPGASNFFPLTTPQQEWYTASTGTSHSTPAVAGGAALLRQQFINRGLAPPSPALTKAMLMNSARHLTGASAGDSLWSNSQGMGLMDLGRLFDGGEQLLRDQLPADRFDASGVRRTYTALVDDANRPVRVTLAWTDAPGPTFGAPQLNNLDLVVIVGNDTYKGNVFAGASSTTGGNADGANNVESVFLAPASAGTPVLIQVTAANIVADGVPQSGGALDQDFALIGANLTPATIPVVRSEAPALVSESFIPANAAPDPGEHVSYALALANVGTADANDVVATLDDSGGVLDAPPPVSYGDLIVDAAPVSRTFAFAIDPALACGADVVATWDLTADGAPLGSVTRTFPTGEPEAGVIESFDGVPTPALPAGWTSTAASGSPWITTATLARSAPYAAFASDPASVSDKSLVSPAFAVSTSAAEVHFFHRYALETTFDGAVLEIAIGAAPFTDLRNAGGAFIVGGYNATLSSSTNPLHGRAAWTGSFNTAWQEVIATLPASANGQSVRLRWRVGTDALTAATGYFIDDVRIVNARRCASDSVFANGFE